jgi:hypothetical protein
MPDEPPAYTAAGNDPKVTAEEIIRFGDKKLSPDSLEIHMSS